MKKISKTQLFRTIIQIIMLILIPGVWSLAFSELKSLFNMILNNSFSFQGLSESFIVLILTAIMGRFFCGWFCAFGTFGDIIYGLSHKIAKIKYRIDPEWDKVLKYIKYALLLFLVIFSWTGILSLPEGSSPWDAFAQFPDIKFMVTDYTIGLILLIFIAIGSVFVERFFCRYLCPLGAIFAMLSKIRIFKINKPVKNCSKCTLCTYKCSMGIDLSKTDVVTSGECIQCYKCTDVCPKKNAAASVNTKKINTYAASAAAVAVIGSGLFFSNKYLAGKTGTVSSGSITTGNTSGTDSSSSGSASSSTSYKDGTYTGTGRGYKPGLTVSVTITGGKISDIRIVSSNETPSFSEEPFKTIPAEIIDAQSLNVDTVSGATRSSEGIIAAVKAALEQAI
ncbi:MAG: 4Fe-4S binding protein [Clostridiaceae bacterium]